jgi:hypothetical protein
MVVTHEKESAVGTQKGVGVAAEPERVVDVLHGLKAGDQT